MADIAIDLGTQNIRIFIPGKGIVVNEPCVISVDSHTGDIIAIGQDAYNMFGRTSKRMSVLYPLVNGVISDFALVEQMIRYFLKKVSSNMIVMPRVVACIPGDITEVEKRAVVNAISTAGVRKICLIEEPVAAAIGAGIDIFKPHGSFVVDIGAGTTEMAVISLSGVAVMKSIKIAGNDFNELILKHVRRKHTLIIGEITAENLKKAVGCVYPQDEVYNFTVKGRNALTGMPQAIEIESSEIMPVISGVADQIANVVKETLEEAPPELVSDIFMDGITLTGGSASMRGFDQVISEKTKLKVNIAEEPELCVLRGIGESLKYIDALVKKSPGVLNPLVVEY